METSRFREDDPPINFREAGIPVARKTHARASIYARNNGLTVKIVVHDQRAMYDPQTDEFTSTFTGAALTVNPDGRTREQQHFKRISSRNANTRHVRLIRAESDIAIILL